MQPLEEKSSGLVVFCCFTYRVAWFVSIPILLARANKEAGKSEWLSDTILVYFGHQEEGRELIEGLKGSNNY